LILLGLELFIDYHYIFDNFFTLLLPIPNNNYNTNTKDG
jgi:hypothetical protein